MMKAKLTKDVVHNGKNYGGDKETIDTYNVVAYHKGEFLTPVTARIYMGRSASATTVYASIWCHNNQTGVSLAGTGSAGGGGYHKASAALGEAISRAGIKLYGSPYERDAADMKKECHIGGVGERAMEDALLAIGRALGYRKITVVRG